jgi:hypothetical protein
MYRLHLLSGVSYQTIHALVTQDRRVKFYDVAKRISDATRGVVSIAELCESRRVRVRKRKRRAAAAVRAAA